MSSMKIVFTETPTTIHNPHDIDFTLLPEDAEYSVALYIPDEPIDSETNSAFVEEVRDADIIIDNFVYFGKELIDVLERCKIISFQSIAFSEADLEYAKEKGIAVASIRDYCHQEVAETAMAAMMCLQRNILNYSRSVQEKKVWNTIQFPNMIRIEGQTISLIGCGRNGQHVAKIAKGLGMRLLGYDPYLPAEVAEELGIQMVDFDTAMEEADVVSVHAVLTEETRYMFDEEAFRKMKKHPIFINVGRGQLVRESVVKWALEEGMIRGAALDVLESEDPDLNDCVLIGSEMPENLIITPHIGYLSTTSDYLCRKYSVDNALNYYFGKYDEVHDIRNGVRA